MMKQTILALLMVVLLASCSSIKPLSSSKDVSGSTKVVNSTPRFLDIEVSPETSTAKTGTVRRQNAATSKKQSQGYLANSSTTIEQASPLQFKYALLLNTDVEAVTNIKLYEYIDEWYGTRYCLGGTTKSCIDCSAFVQSFYSALYNSSRPRTARDQYKSAQKISSTELQEGDLLFFNTRGGVSHVGIYLQHNKFVHASTSGGVMISDMFEPYYVRHFIGAGRIEKNDELAKN
jgi:lipoprotein Spr